MPTQSYVYITTARGQVRLYPKEVTGLDKSRYQDTDITVYHGASNRANVYITYAEAREFVEKMPDPLKCPAYMGECYGRRETDLPNPACLSCRLRQYIYDNGQGDLRTPLRANVHPLKAPIIEVSVFMLASWLIIQAANVPIRAAEERAAMWQSRYEQLLKRVPSPRRPRS